MSSATAASISPGSSDSCHSGSSVRKRRRFFGMNTSRAPIDSPYGEKCSGFPAACHFAHETRDRRAWSDSCIAASSRFAGQQLREPGPLAVELGTDPGHSIFSAADNRERALLAVRPDV